jgi:hypothetical protein
MKTMMFVVVTTIATLSCSSSDGVRYDIGEATITESKAEVRRCEYVTKVRASVDLREYDQDRDAAMQALFDRLRSSTLHERCDTVYLVTVEETRTYLTAIGEGYRCEPSGIGREARGSGGP